MARTNHDVNFLEEPEACALAPTDVVAHAGEEVTWHTGNSSITLIFPLPRIFPEGHYTVEANSHLTLVIPTGTESGHYGYDAYCHLSRQLAGDGQHPDIEIV